jgi:hypothetical protein
MGLSSDPEKRARQLANLGLGWKKNAERLAAGEPAPPAPERETKPDLEVLDYDSGPAPEPAKQKPKPASKAARKPRKPAASPVGDRPAEPEPEPGGGLWGELKAGFLGG